MIRDAQLIAPRAHTFMWYVIYAHTHQVIRHCSPIVISSFPFLCCSYTVRIVAFVPAMKRIASVLYHYLLLNMLQSHWSIECVVHSHHSYHLVIQIVGPVWKKWQKQRIITTPIDTHSQERQEREREKQECSTHFVIGFWGLVVGGAGWDASKIVVLLGIGLR